MGQNDDVESLGRKTTQAGVNIFLNDIQAFLYRADQIIRIDFDAHAGDATFSTESVQKSAVSAAQIQHVTTSWNPIEHRVEVQTIHDDGPTRCIHSDSKRS